MNWPLAAVIIAVIMGVAYAIPASIAANRINRM
jgi:biopolymer transport protein ExbB/TolQ